MFFFFLVPAIQSVAQDPNNNYCVDKQGAATGGFTLDKEKVCVGEAVRIAGGIPTGLANTGYIPQYGGKGIPVATQPGPVFQYTTPGSFTILQVGTINGLRAVACREVTVLPLDPIKFTAKGCSGRQALVNVALDASTSQYDSYIITGATGETVHP